MGVALFGAHPLAANTADEARRVM